MDEKAVDRPQQRRHRDPLDAQLQRVVGLAQQIGLSAQHHRDIQRLRRRDPSETPAMRIAVNPQRVELPAPQASAKPERPRPPEREPASRADARQKFMAVAVEQRHVPFHVHAEARIAIRVDRQITEKKNCQLDSRTRRKIAKQRRLVLDRMADEARNAVAAVHLKPPAASHRDDARARVRRPRSLRRRRSP